MMAAFGFSINTLTLCGLVLAIGLVVDDAIIVVENVEKYLDRGLRPLAATRAAMAEITAPIVTITLVLAAVFVPVAFIPGMTGRLYNQFAMTIVFSFVFSAFNSLTFSPAMARLFLRRKHGETKFFLFRWFNAGMQWLENSYDSFLEFTAHHWWTIVVPSLGLLALTGWMLVERPKAFIPTEDQGYLIAVIQTPDGTSGEKTAAGHPARRARSPRSWRASAHVVAARGLERHQLDQPDQRGVVFVPLKEWHERNTPGAAGRRPGQAAPGPRSSPRSATPSVMVLQPPPIRGLSQTGGFEFMIEDRDGQGRRGPRAGHRPVPRRGPEAARAGRRLHDLLRPRAAAPVRPRPHQGPAARRAGLRRLRRRSRPTSAATTSTTSTSTARSGRSWSRPRGASATKPEDIQNLYVLNRKGERVPLELAGRGPVRARADRRAALQPVHRGQDHRPARPRLQLGPGARRDGGGRRQGPARGLRLRVDRHHLPGAEDRQPGDLHLRPVGRLRLPVHGGPLRELDPAAR